MHETSLIDYALNAVETKATQMGIREVREVGLVIGKAKAVPLLMEKAFQIIRMKHPMCREASLHLDVREIRMQCAACGTEFESLWSTTLSRTMSKATNSRTNNSSTKSNRIKSCTIQSYTIQIL